MAYLETATMEVVEVKTKAVQIILMITIMVVGWRSKEGSQWKLMILDPVAAATLVDLEVTAAVAEAVVARVSWQTSEAAQLRRGMKEFVEHQKT